MSLKVPEKKSDFLNHTRDTQKDLSRTRQTVDIMSRDTSNWKGHNSSCWCKTRRENLNTPQFERDKKNNLIPGQLKQEYLEHLFRGEIDELKDVLAKRKESIKIKDYKCDVLLCFWFSIHQEKVNEAQFLYELDPIIR